MATKIADLVVNLSANIAEFRSSMEQANQSVKHAQDVIISSQGQVRAAIQAVGEQMSVAREQAAEFLEAVAAVEVAHKAVEFFRESAEAAQEWAEQLEKFQNIAGLSSQAAATLAASAQLTGVNADTLTQAMARLGSAIANNPQKFAQLGIAIRDAQGNLLPMQEIMRATITGLDEFKAGTDRAAAAGFIFGRGAEAWLTQLEKLGPALKAGEWNEAGAMVRALGLSMEDARARAEEWARVTGELKLAWLGVENEIGSALLPALESLAGDVVRLAENGELKQWADDAASAVLYLGEALVKTADGVVSAWQHPFAAVTSSAAWLLGASDKLSGAIFDSLAKLGGGGSEAAAQLHTALQKMAADMETARARIGQPINLSVQGGGEAPGAGKAFADPAAAKQTQAFEQEYEKLLARYQGDLDYQARLRTAYQEGAAAVRALEIAHAGEEAAERVLAAAQKEHVAVSKQELDAVYAAAAGAKQAQIAASEQKTATDALAHAEKEHEAQVRRVMEATDAMSKKARELAAAEGILLEQYQKGAITLQDYQSRIQQAQKVYSDNATAAKEAASQITAAVERGASAFLDAATATDKHASALRRMQLAAAGLEKDLAKMVLQVLVFDRLKERLQGFFGSAGGGGGGAGGFLSSLGGMLGFGGHGAAGEGPAGAQLSAAATEQTTAAAQLSAAAAALAAAASTMTGQSAASAIATPAAESGGLSSWLGSFSLPGFASGGEFDVGGGGGTDTSLVAFRATPGEHVSVGRREARGDEVPPHFATMIDLLRDIRRTMNAQARGDSFGRR